MVLMRRNAREKDSRYLLHQLTHDVVPVKVKRRIIGLARLLFFLALLVALYAGMKSKPFSQFFAHFDLILHASAFMLLAFLWLLSVSRDLRYWGLFGLLLLGAGIEIWQAWLMPSRTGSIMDMTANAVGIFLGLLIFSCCSRIFSRKY